MQPAKPILLKTSIATLALMFAVSCTQNPYTGEEEVSNTAKGAGAGAVLGGILAGLGTRMAGGDADEARRNALIGLGVGLLAGAMVGQRIDQQEAQLREELEAAGVSVTRRGENIVLNMDRSLVFESGESEVPAQSRPVLVSLSKVLVEFESFTVDVLGFSDSHGDEALNQQISKQRALNVAEELVANGVEPLRLTAIGMGEVDPIAPNDTPEGRALNRRVEIHIAPLT